MDLDNSFSVLIYQVGWSLPTCLTVVVIAVVAVVQAGTYQAQWAVSMITVALNVATLALIGSGAVVGRGRAVAR